MDCEPRIEPSGELDPPRRRPPRRFLTFLHDGCSFPAKVVKGAIYLVSWKGRSERLIGFAFALTSKLDHYIWKKQDWTRHVLTRLWFLPRLPRMPMASARSVGSTLLYLMHLKKIYCSLTFFWCPVLLAVVSDPRPCLNCAEIQFWALRRVPKLRQQTFCHVSPNHHKAIMRAGCAVMRGYKYEMGGS